MLEESDIHEPIREPSIYTSRVSSIYANSISTNLLPRPPKRSLWTKFTRKVRHMLGYSKYQKNTA